MKYLPWILIVALLVGVGLLYSSNQKKDAELGQVQSELEQARAASSETNQAPSPPANDELTRLRAENQDLLRLRNEVRKLREENQQLNHQAQTAQAQAQSAQAQVEATRTSAAQALAQAQQLEANTRVQQQTAACINNLRQIDGAKQQWALEQRKTAESPVTQRDIMPYFRNNIFPTCPAGGIYTLNTVGVLPTCSVPGHALPKAP